MIRIKDIANKAGVSATTVSNVIHGNTKKVSPESVVKINQIIQELNYIPNMGARMLVKNGSKIIGVIINYPKHEEKNAVQDPFNSALIGSLEKAIRHHGYYMMLCAADGAEEVLKLATTWNIDGLVMLGINPDNAHQIKQSTDKPIVFIDSYFDFDNIEYEIVGLEDEEGGYQMANYLLESGHRRVAFLADIPEPMGVDWWRLQGCKRAFREAGVPFGRENYIEFSRNYYQRQEDFKKLLPHIHNFSALFFSSDYYAVNAMNFFYDHGVMVPRDISVVGFDDNYLALSVRPKLTTVRQNVEQKGQCAVGLLVQLMRGEPVAEHNIRLPIQLIVRDSVRNVPV